MNNLSIKVWLKGYPTAIWIARTYRSFLLEFKLRSKKLKIGKMVDINDCEFGFHNLINDYFYCIKSKNW